MQEFDNNKVPVKKLWQVIVASSVGTVIEWYDFYIFGSLSAIISVSFFPKEDPTAAFLSTWAAFGAGFVARPFGGVLFGRLGDLIGRKYTFLLTLLLMGGSTFAIAFIPSYEKIGLVAPAVLLALRIIQGLALGGEYGAPRLTWRNMHRTPNAGSTRPTSKRPPRWASSSPSWSSWRRSSF